MPIGMFLPAAAASAMGAAAVAARNLRREIELCGVMPKTLARCKHRCAPQSCLIQDEPGGGAGFSYKMSLEERSRMLGFDHQRADIGTIEPGADSGVFGRQFRGRIQGPESRGGIRLGGSDATAATIRRADPQRAWIGAAVRGEDDWTEPCADDAADH